jgi:hypothetical protein
VYLRWGPVLLVRGLPSAARGVWGLVKVCTHISNFAWQDCFLRLNEDNVQVTAFGCIGESAQTGTVPTGVQFSYGNIGSSSGDAASASASASADSSSEPLVSLSYLMFMLLDLTDLQAVIAKDVLGGLV